MIDRVDSKLEARLRALADAVPVQPGPVAIAPVTSRIGVGSSGRRFGPWTLSPLVALVVVAVLAGGTLLGLGALNGPVSASTTDGDFEVSIQSPKALWPEGEAIQIEGSLTFHGGEPTAEIWHGQSTPLGFGIVEPVEGMRLNPAWRQSCEATTLSRDVALTRAFSKSGGWTQEDPAASRYDAWFADPEVHLPVGTWHVFVVAAFAEGECGGPLHDIRATIDITVIEAAGKSMTPPPATPDVDAVGETDSQGPYALEIHANRAVYEESDAINVWAALHYASDAPQITIAHAGLDPLGFGIAEPVHGLRLEPNWEVACRPRLLTPDFTINRAFERTTGLRSLDDDQRAFLEDSHLSLPAGTWHLSAVASFFEGDCLARGPEVRLEVEIEITVLPIPTIPPTTYPEVSPGPLQPDGGVLGVASDPLFELRIADRSAANPAGEAIDVQTRLSYLGAGQGVTFGHAYPSVTFSVEQLDGVHRAWGAAADSCNATTIKAEEPIDVSFGKPGADYLGGRDRDWAVAFNREPLLRLTPGTWRISAYFEGSVPECGGEPHQLQASIVILVQ